MINCQIDLQKLDSDFRNHQADDSIRCQLPEASGKRCELLYHDLHRGGKQKLPPQAVPKRMAIRACGSKNRVAPTPIGWYTGEKSNEFRQIQTAKKTGGLS